MISSTTLKALVRPMFVGPFTVVDYSAIESRVLAWIAGEGWKTQAFFEGRDMYVEIAERMGDYSRQQGKTAELALGFAGGIGALRRMGAKEETDEELHEIKDLWRSLHPRTTAFWRAMDLGFQQGGPAGRINWVRKGRDMHAILPSGRPLVYRDARVFYDPIEGRQMTYLGPQGQRMFTWHGSLVENCLAGDTPVLTERGWVRLDTVQIDDRVWDGEEWVKHEGLKNSGEQSVIDVSGVMMTPDHKIMTARGWLRAEQGRGLGWPVLRLPDSAAAGGPSWDSPDVAVPVLLRDRDGEGGFRTSPIGQEGLVAFLRMSDREADLRGASFHRASSNLAPAVPSVASSEVPLRAANRPRMGQLRRAGGRLLRTVAGLLGLRRGHGTDVLSGADAGPGGQRRAVLTRELPVGEPESASPEQAHEPVDRHSVGGALRQRGGRAQRAGRDHPALPTEARSSRGRPLEESRLQEPVYDLLNCGPRHRFTVLTERGPLIVHNCVQATAREILAAALVRLHERGYPIVGHVHDEVLLEGLFDVKEIADQMCELEPWMSGLPLAAEGQQTNRYTK